MTEYEKKLGQIMLYGTTEVTENSKRLLQVKFVARYFHITPFRLLKCINPPSHMSMWQEMSDKITLKNHEKEDLDVLISRKSLVA